jgi:peptidoglycan/xylan/chitin deacetylase (PgdA/CDA1 family)
MGFHNLRSIIGRISRGVVLAFHDISPGRFVDLVECLYPAEPVSLAEIVERSKNSKSTSGLFAITVDDGVGANVRGLAQAALNHEWPITFYLPTKYLDTGEGMIFQYWRQLQPFLPQTAVNLSAGPLDLSRPKAIEELSRKMERLWHTARLETYYPVTMELAELISRSWGREAVSTPAPITWAEVEQLSKHDLIRFESHSVSHVAMSSLGDNELEFEMRHSRDTVAAHTGRPCRHLAYPFGSPASIGIHAARIAERFYDSATTMSLGHIDNADPLLLPRIPFYPENSKAVARFKILLYSQKISLRQHPTQ